MTKHNATKFAERIHPGKLGFSPKLVAVVGAIIGYDYGVRDRRGGRLTSIAITSDGFVTARSTASDGGGAFIGDARELELNLEDYKDDLSDADRAAFERLYAARVRDWREL